MNDFRENAILWSKFISMCDGKDCFLQKDDVSVSLGNTIGEVNCITFSFLKSSGFMERYFIIQIINHITVSRLFNLNIFSMKLFLLYRYVYPLRSNEFVGREEYDKEISREV